VTTHEAPAYTRRQQRLRRRALKNLRTALGEAGEQLTPDWVLRDPDLSKLRLMMTDDPSWAALMGQLRKAHRKKPPRVRVPERRHGKVTVPEHPWHPLVPILFWLAAGIGFGVLFARALANGAYWLFIVAAGLGTLASAAFLFFALNKRLFHWRIPWRRRADKQGRADDERAE
jgi:hypothetical protein